MTIIELDTGLFPDAQTVSAALRQVARRDTVEAIDLRQRELRESDWDEVMQKLLAADRIVCI
ncbi:MAG: hypothetical protein ACOY6N_06715 [Pseudomonadota bacterium]|uniref:hypothetical protein n=1 Tax=Sulfuricystis thermophila TaxID=2496847 RepID=UPI001035B0B0|nr:hypothetical protein [Sulfuricystis thermophila]